MAAFFLLIFHLVASGRKDLTIPNIVPIVGILPVIIMLLITRRNSLHKERVLKKINYLAERAERAAASRRKMKKM